MAVPMANDPPFATLNHVAADLGIPNESEPLRVGISFHGFLSERKFLIHKVPLETYMSKLWVYVLTAPSEAFFIQPATMWKTHTPTVLVDAAIVLSKRALPAEYRQLNPSSRSHVYPFSPMTSVTSFSPH